MRNLKKTKKKNKQARKQKQTHKHREETGGCQRGGGTGLGKTVEGD